MKLLCTRYRQVLVEGVAFRLVVVRVFFTLMRGLIPPEVLAGLSTEAIVLSTPHITFCPAALSLGRN